VSDQVWQTVRYVLIGGGAFLAGRGKLDPAQVAPMADQIITIASGAASLAAAAWGLYVKWQTATVPAATAARPDVPVVSSATGALKPE
jgi:hypothetical protein